MQSNVRARARTCCNFSENQHFPLIPKEMASVHFMPQEVKVRRKPGHGLHFH